MVLRKLTLIRMREHSVEHSSGVFVLVAGVVVVVVVVVVRGVRLVSRRAARERRVRRRARVLPRPARAAEVSTIAGYIIFNLFTNLHQLLLTEVKNGTIFFTLYKITATEDLFPLQSKRT